MKKHEPEKISGSSIERKHFHFTGRVQGVGFRWRARTYAESLQLTGWVRNEWDDSVTMEVQGEPAAINALLKSLGTSRYVVIEGLTSRTVPVIPEESRFRVLSS